MGAYAIQGCRRSETDRALSTHCSRRADAAEGERGRMRRLIFTTIAALAASSASAQHPLPAEANVRAALERISRIDPHLHSVIAVDPTAIEQARRVDASNMRG